MCAGGGGGGVSLVVKTPKPVIVKMIVAWAASGIESPELSTRIGPPTIEAAHPAMLSFCGADIRFSLFILPCIKFPCSGVSGVTVSSANIVGV